MLEIVTDGGCFYHEFNVQNHDFSRLFQTNAEVTLMIDGCGNSEGAFQENGLEYPPALVDCLFTLPHTPGVDRAVNVDQWPLQLGGRKLPNIASIYPNELTTYSLPAGSAFRHVMVNGELWNLAQFGPSQNTAPAPLVCLNQNGQDVCAPNVGCIFLFRPNYSLTD